MANYALGRAGAHGAAQGAAGAYAMGAGRAMRGMGASGRRTLAGAAAGGMYGGISDDTSVIGGMAMGGAIGRYGGAALRRGKIGRRGIGVGTPGMGGAMYGGGMGIRNQAIMDARSIRRLASNAGQSVASLGARAGAAVSAAGAKLRGNQAVNPVAAGGATMSAIRRRSPRMQEDIRLNMMEDIVRMRGERVGAMGGGGPRGSVLGGGMSSESFAGAMGTYR